MILYKKLTPEDIRGDMLKGFDRYQQVTRVWRIENGEKRLVDCTFTEYWSDEEKAHVVATDFARCAEHGAVICAFDGDRVVGFATVPGARWGSEGEYLFLTMLHVSSDSRRLGIGKALMLEAARHAAGQGAKKLYISSHSSEESQRFYQAMGCVDARQVCPEMAEHEPYDIQLEYEIPSAMIG